MKYLIVLLVGISFISCDKSKFDKDYEVCKNNDYEDPDAVDPTAEKYVLDELVYNEEGCIQEGSIKYAEDFGAVVVKYYQKDGITQGHKTYYKDDAKKCGFGMSGKKDKKEAPYGCTFRPTCDPDDENILSTKSAE